MNLTPRRLIGTFGVLLFVGAPSQAHAVAGEVKTYTYQRQTTCQTVTTYTNWDNMCDAFHDGVTASSTFDTGGQVVNSGSRQPEVDDELVAGGTDDTGLDDADVAMICAHGYDQGAAGWRHTTDSSWNSDCSARRQHMSVGDQDLEQLFLSSCNSMDKEDISAWNDGADPTANGVHGIHGFHGVMYISSTEISRYDDAADDALNVSISSGWLWSLYSDDWDGAGSGTDDQCPVTVHWGTTESDALDRLYDDTLITSYNDSDNPTPNWYARWGVADCDPAGDVAW